jgi:hypothetical protein
MTSWRMWATSFSGLKGGFTVKMPNPRYFIP